MLSSSSGNPTFDADDIALPERLEKQVRFLYKFNDIVAAGTWCYFIDANGAITDVQILSGGSAYGIGNTLTVVGVATTAGHIVGVVSVTSIYNNVGDVIKVAGVSSSSYQDYNSLYRISSIVNSKQIVATSTTSVSGFTSTGRPIS